MPLEGKDAFLFAALAIVVGVLAFGKLAAVYSLLFGSLLALWSWGVDLRELSNAMAIWIDVSPPDLLYYAFLPPLLVDGAMRLDWRIFRRVSVHVVLTAVVMVLLTALTLTPIVLYVMRFASRGWSWVHGALLASMLAATDAIAATAILKQGGGPERLVVLLEGEAMLNDASGITLFAAFFKLFERHESPSEPFPTVWEALPGIIGSIARLAGIGLGIGLGIAVVHGLLLALLRRRRFPASDAAVEATLALGMAYLAFYVANGPAGGSGVIAVVVMGLWGAATGRWSAPAETAGGGGGGPERGWDNPPLDRWASSEGTHDESEGRSSPANSLGCDASRGSDRVDQLKSGVRVPELDLLKSDRQNTSELGPAMGDSCGSSKRVRIVAPCVTGNRKATNSSLPRPNVVAPEHGGDALNDRALLQGDAFNGRTPLQNSASSSSAPPRSAPLPSPPPPLPPATAAVHSDPFLAAWDTIALAANGVAFTWTGIVCVTSIIRASKALGYSPWSYGGAFLVYVISLALRFLLVRLFTPFYVLCEEPLSIRETLFVTWAGLRGVVSSIMVLDVVGASHFRRATDLENARAGLADDPVVVQYREEDIASLELVLWTSIFVLLTLFINAPLLGPVMKALKLGDALGGPAGRRARARAGREMRKEAKRAVVRLSKEAGDVACGGGANGRERWAFGAQAGDCERKLSGEADAGSFPQSASRPTSRVGAEFRGADWSGVLTYVRKVVSSVPGFGPGSDGAKVEEADKHPAGSREPEPRGDETDADLRGRCVSRVGVDRDAETRRRRKPDATTLPPPAALPPPSVAAAAPPPSDLLPSPSRSVLPSLFFSRDASHAYADPDATLIRGIPGSDSPCAHQSSPPREDLPRGGGRASISRPPLDPFLPPPRPPRAPVTIWVLLGFPPARQGEGASEERAGGPNGARGENGREETAPPSPPPAPAPGPTSPSADEVRRRALSALQSLVRARRSRGEMSGASARAIGEAIAEVTDELEKRGHAAASRRAQRAAGRKAAALRSARSERWSPKLSIWNHLMWRSLQLGWLGRTAHALAVACEDVAARVTSEGPARKRAEATVEFEDAISMASSVRCSASGPSFADGSACGVSEDRSAAAAPLAWPLPSVVARAVALPFSLLAGIFRAPYGGLSLLACESASEVSLLARQVARQLDADSEERGRAGLFGRASAASSAAGSETVEAAAELKTLRLALAVELRGEAERAEAFLAALSAWDPALLEAVQSARAARRVLDALLGWTERAEIAGHVDEAEASDVRAMLQAAKRSLEVDGWKRPSDEACFTRRRAPARRWQRLQVWWRSWQRPQARDRAAETTANDVELARDGSLASRARSSDARGGGGGGNAEQDALERGVQSRASR